MQMVAPLPTAFDMSHDEPRARLQSMGALEKEASKRQEVWAIKDEISFRQRRCRLRDPCRQQNFHPTVLMDQ